ncbi:MAG: head-tail adaptor protein [Clostridia bacterium]|nr:head-tail adaptor protein [Clostridia bacterium]
MNTRVRFLRIVNGAKKVGEKPETVDVFGRPVYCSWVWSHGTEALDNYSAQLGQVATLTMYHTPRVSKDMRVVLEDEQALLGTENGPFTIISINPVQNRQRFLEIQVRR